jgi:hypothetical protein
MWLPTSPNPEQGESGLIRSSRLIDPRMRGFNPFFLRHIWHNINWYIDELIMPRERNPFYQAQEAAQRLTGAERHVRFLRLLGQIDNSLQFYGLHQIYITRNIEHAFLPECTQKK